jgi:DNA polymerase-3 subunit chi
VTQVDFYVLNGNSDSEWFRLASRIAEKAMSLGQRVFINTENEDHARRLDEILWTFSQGSFVPHRIVDANTADTPPEPVLIGAGIEPKQQPWQVLINLSATVPEYFSRFERVAEVIDADDSRRASGRERFRFYRERGYELNTHNIS